VLNHGLNRIGLGMMFVGVVFIRYIYRRLDSWTGVSLVRGS
jgi:hypothetical protein